MNTDEYAAIAAAWEESYEPQAVPMTKEAWRRGVEHRALYRPTLPTPAEYRGWSATRRGQFDKDRWEYNGQLVLAETDQVSAVHAQIRQKFATNLRRLGTRHGVVVSGPGNVGKTTTVTMFGHRTERALRRSRPDLFTDSHIECLPVVYITLHSKPTAKDVMRSFALFLNVPHTARTTTNELMDVVVRVLVACRTRLVIIDEVQNLTRNSSEGHLANDQIKSLMNVVPATFVYVGVDVERTRLFGEGTYNQDTQTSSRLTLARMDPYCLHVNRGRPNIQSDVQHAEVAAWVAVIKTFESSLALFDHRAPTLAQEWPYLLSRTAGRLGSLADLLIAGARLAMSTGTERINVALLDGIPIDYASEVALRRNGVQRSTV